MRDQELQFILDRIVLFLNTISKINAQLIEVNLESRIECAVMNAVYDH